MARVMALDVGERRVGVALSDAGGRIAAPHATLANRGLRRLAGRIAAQPNSLFSLMQAMHAA